MFILGGRAIFIPIVIVKCSNCIDVLFLCFAFMYTSELMSVEQVKRQLRSGGVTCVLRCGDLKPKTHGVENRRQPKTHAVENRRRFSTPYVIRLSLRLELAFSSGSRFKSPQFDFAHH